MKTLGFDLATHTGWAVCVDGIITRAGSVELAKPAEVTAWGKRRLDRRRDPRMARLKEFAASLYHAEAPVRVAVFEDVEFATYRKQAQMWPSLRTALWLGVPEEVLFDCVNVKTLKKFATGNPDATKADMIISLMRYHPDQFRVIERNRKPFALHIATGTVCDDDAVDAIHAALWATKTYKSNPGN